MLWCDQNSLSNGVYGERIWNFFLKKFVPFLKILLYFGKIWNIYFLRKNRILYTLRVCHLLAQPLSLPSFCRIHSNMQLGVFNIWTHFEGLSCSNKGLRKFDPFGIEKNICKCWQSLCQVCRNDIFTACHGHLVPCPIACLAWKLRLAAGGSGRRLPQCGSLKVCTLRDSRITLPTHARLTAARLNLGRLCDGCCGYICTIAISAHFLSGFITFVSSD